MGVLKYPLLKDRALMEDLYVRQHKSFSQIGREVGGAHEVTVANALRKHDIPIRNARGPKADAPFERPVRIGGCQCERPMPGPEGCQKCGRELPGISPRLATQPFFPRGRMIA